jgi:hypothetical protein
MSVLRNFSHEGFQLRLVLNHIFQNGLRESFPMDSTLKFSERKLKNHQWVPTGLDLDQQMVFDQMEK